MRKLYKCLRRRPLKTLALVVLLPFMAVNFLAYQHAYAMTHFVQEGGWMRKPGGGWIGRPESLSLWTKVRMLLFGVRVARPWDDATPSDVSLPHETHTAPGPAGALDAWYIPHDQPHGVALIFHGFNGCKARMLPETKGFHSLGYACFVVDFRGSGGSAGNTTTVGFREAEDVAAAVSYVRARWPKQPVLLFGQSMGAAAVLRAVGELDVEADALVLECPFDRMLTAVRARFRAMGMISFPFAESLVFWGGVQHRFNAFTHNPVEYARHVNCPVLLLHGGMDSRVRQTELRAIHDQLPGEKALHIFTELGHESYAGSQFEEWRQQVAEFLLTQGLSRRRAG